MNRSQKECPSTHCLKVDDLRLVEETKLYLKIVHNEANKIKIVDKFIRRK